MSKVGKRLIAAAKEARDIAAQRTVPAHIYIQADVDVKAIRRKMSLSQDGFASEFGFSVHQIRNWEQGRTRLVGGERAYLLIIDRNPEVVREALAGLRKDKAA